MTKALCRIFIKDPENVKSPQVRLAYGRLAGVTGIVCNLLLCGGKLLAGMLAGSLAMIADAFNNLSDAGSSIVTLVGFKLAGAPPDEDHPFGHGRMEYLSTLGVAVLIILAGFELASSALDKILHPEEPVFSVVSAVILLLSIGVKLWMAMFNRHLGNRIHSDTLLATGTDSRNDVICTGVVLASSIVSWRTGWSLDGYVGMAVALFVMWSGFSIIRDTISPLLGQAPDPELVKEIEQTVLAHEGVVGIHDMILHDYGPGRMMLSLHAEVPQEQSIRISHDIIDNIEVELMERFNLVSCIHMDPIDTDDPETLELKAMACQVLSQLDERLTLHDFRVVAGDTHTNLLFDVVVPHDYPHRQQLPARIQEAIQQIDPKLFTVLKVETSYI
ncbi:MAG: cation transporter [Clostridia bacterium]|nr:cation transporter [Clostridia bacterium]